MREAVFADVTKSPCCKGKYRLRVSSHSWCVEKDELRRLRAAIARVLR